MRQRKINDSQLITLKKEGMLQKNIAKVLGVSEPAITQRLKKLFPEKYEAPKSLEVLTDKEQRFAIERASGRTATQAALKAYECSSLQSAKVIGSQLMGKPDVQTAISDLMEMKGIGRNFRVDKLGEHMRHPDPVVSLKALDMGFKLSGDEEEAKRKPSESHTYLEIDFSLFKT